MKKKAEMDAGLFFTGKPKSNLTSKSMSKHPTVPKLSATIATLSMMSGGGGFVTCFEKTQEENAKGFSPNEFSHPPPINMFGANSSHCPPCRKTVRKQLSRDGKKKTQAGKLTCKQAVLFRLALLDHYVNILLNPLLS